jgi:hypothetical protein
MVVSCDGSLWDALELLALAGALEVLEVFEVFEVFGRTIYCIVTPIHRSSPFC